LVGTILGGVGASRAAVSSSVTRHVDPSDFNGDGYADLAIGAPYEGGGPPAYDEPGVVNVLYGGVSGISAFGDQLWSQDSHGVLGTSGRFDHFGGAIASEDFDGDGFADLAVGSPLDEEGDAQGSVNVLYGSPDGLRRLRNQLWLRDDLRHGPFAGPEDAFGSVLAAGDLDGDGYADLAIGAPCAIVLSRECAGAVHVL
jgi:FG-GAP repeat